MKAIEAAELPLMTIESPIQESDIKVFHFQYGF
jgi:hypothetical protein